ncbi:MAG: hypothetical protein FFODKBPE_00179 [Candidatus Argoarchaeum ethanivorans]|uniref:Uncharacterized protein n=1 Tax=Candidatus Argoarchaeum ethanivorans TaxID=2608793 RepID=A0A811T6Z6_9EURY|nr:MAG: hypothetical protein FFODKBPE_00179 [Candidatus Argoarchaeum ethanivorans]
METQKIRVTGGAGFMGSNLVRELVDSECCAFDSNVLCSTLKHPIDNFHLISNVLMESVKRQIGKR